MKRKSTLLKDALILFGITCIAGFLLGAVYTITKEPIARQEEKAKTAAYQKVCPLGVTFDESIFEVDDGKEGTIQIAVGNGAAVVIQGAARALNAAEEAVGYVIQATSASYGGDLTLAVGFDTEGVITGIEILEISDTPGLGMKAKEDPSFASQFVGKAAGYDLELVKSGASGENQVDAIAGATVTSQAFMDGVKAAGVFLQQLRRDME